MDRSDCLMAVSGSMNIGYLDEQVEQVVQTAEHNPGVIVAFDTGLGHGAGHVVFIDGSFEVAG